jgi:histidinol-phosphate aminotransferase
LEIEAYQGGKSATQDARPAVKLSANESAIGPSPKAIAAFKSVAGQLHRYPDGSSERLRGAIARRHNLDPARIVCGAGSDELIALLTKAYAGPGEEVLFSEHGFLMYKLAALGAGATPVAALETGLRADVDALLGRVTSRSRIVFIANPNNPTGSYLSGEEITRLHAGLPEEVLLVVDAAYAEFVEVDDYDSGLELAMRAKNVVMTRTFSKLYGLASLRLGWMYGPAAVVDVINRLRGPFNVSLPAQEAGIAALEDLEHEAKARRHNATWLPWLERELRSLGLEVNPSAGNFVLVAFPMQLGQDAASANRHLEADGLIPRQMAAYGLPHCLRISVGLEAENRAVVASLKRFVEGRVAA